MHLHGRAVAALLHRPPGQSGAIRSRWKPFNYTYHFFWGLEDVIAVFTNMWGQLKTDKSVGGLFPNDGDGNAWGDKMVGFPPVLDKLGYKLTDPGRYQNLTDDFSAQIAAFKKANCDIVTGVVIPPDFTTFWNQAQQQGFKPKVASIGKAHPVPGRGRSARQERQQPLLRGLVDAEPSVQVVADRHVGQGACRRLREGLGQAVDAADRLRACAVRGRRRCAQARAATSDNKAIVKAIAATKLDTVVGQIEWATEKLPPFAQKNIAKTPLVGGQWRLRDGNKYDIVITDNKTAPEIPVGGQMEPIA